MALDPESRLGARLTRRRRRTVGVAPNATLASLVAVLSMVANLHAGPVLALQCFSCADCSVGVALSASKEQCPPEETSCATVSRPQVDGWGHPFSSIHRGCASSLNVACEQSNTPPTTTPTTTQTPSDHHRRESSDGGRGVGDSLTPLCCSTDLCNGSEDTWADGQRRSEEHLRTLMEGNPRKRREGFFSWGAGVGGEGPVGGSGDSSRAEAAAAAATNKMNGEDGNSAQSARAGGVGGSRFATVLVIVGTFSQVLFLVSRLIEE